jgi:hypothetical protein
MYTARMQSHARTTVVEQWILAVTHLWFIGGLFLDGWAHNHVPELETFFTPWHAVFYGGYIASAGILVWMTWRRRAIPIDESWALLGAGLFIVGGIGDLIWHEVFGIEANIDALLSPTHLLLAVSTSMMVGSRLRMVLKEKAETRPRGWIAQLPLVVSALCMLCVLSFMLQFSHFVDRPGAGAIPEIDVVRIFFNPAVSISGILLHGGIAAGIILLLAQAVRMAPGSFTLLLGVSTFAFATMRHGTNALIVAAIVSGITLDLMIPFLIIAPKTPRHPRMLGFLIPFAILLPHFLALRMSEGIWWSVHLWTGSIVMAGIVGILVSFLLWPPRATE